MFRLFIQNLKVSLLISILIGLSMSSSIKNTTSFFNKELNLTMIGESYSGYEDIDWYYQNKSASIYYSLWQGKQLSWSDHNVPLIIWLQGGPGSASQYGCFGQIGPIQIINNNGKNLPQHKHWSWNSFGHLLFVDQPIGVGFSINDGNKIVNNSMQAGDHFMNFLHNFMKNNVWGLEKNPVYLTGQSYAGHYIPVFAQKIVRNSSLNINLAGLIIGDGDIDPPNQVNNFESFLHSVGVISNQFRQTIAYMQKQALLNIMEGNLQKATDYCDFLYSDQTVQNQYHGMSIYNYQFYGTQGYNQIYQKYLQQFKTQFGVPLHKNYNDYLPQMYTAFGPDITKSYKLQLQRLLNLGLKTLIYNGQNDFIVNTAGVLTYLNTLNWKYGKQWRATKKSIWRDPDNNKNLGWTKNYGNFHFTFVRNAGHMVPSDQPRAAWLMLNDYFKN